MKYILKSLKVLPKEGLKFETRAIQHLKESMPSTNQNVGLAVDTVC